MTHETRVYSSIEPNERAELRFNGAEKMQSPSGYSFEVPAHLFVTIGDIDVSGPADEMIALLDDALTRAQAFMDAEEQDA